MLNADHTDIGIGVHLQGGRVYGTLVVAKY